MATFLKITASLFVVLSMAGCESDRIAKLEQQNRELRSLLNKHTVMQDTLIRQKNLWVSGGSGSFPSE
jgi:hypothetical protein